jgi:hypothetical protein
MNTPLLVQNAATVVVIYLEQPDGTPATAVAYTDVTAGIKKNGAGSFTSFAVTNVNFASLGGGFYSLALTSGNTDTLGSLYMNFSGSAFKPSLLAAFVAVATTAPPAPSPGFTPPITAIYGYVYNSAGVPMAGTSVVARVVSQPTIVHPTTDGILIGSDFLSVTTDSTGFFTVSLITGTSVEFIIADANYRRTITVPGSTANLFDIP